MEWHDLADPVGDDDLGAFQGHRALIERQAVKAWSMFAGKPLEPVERAILVEGRDIAFERIGRIEDPRAAARRFLGIHRVRRAVGAEEEFGRARGRGGAHREAVVLALGDGQAIGVRANAADQHGVAIDVEVLRGDRRGDVGGGARDELRRLCGGDMFKDDLELGEGADERFQRALDEHRLAVEDIDVMVGDLAVDQQRHADALHPLEHAHDVGDVGHAMRAAGGGMRGVEFGGGKHALSMAARDFVGVGSVGQIGDDQRGEVEVGGDRGVDPVAIGAAFLGGGHRRRQIGHDDRAGELARGVARDMGQHRAVAQVNVPVVGAADRQAVGHTALAGKMGAWFWLPRP